jgi:hypothetical protein
VTVGAKKAPRYGGGYVTAVVGVDSKSWAPIVPVRPSRAVTIGAQRHPWHGGGTVTQILGLGVVGLGP